MKRCVICKETKPVSEYWKRADGADGLRASCKACGSSRQSRWTAKNLHIKQAGDRRYYEATKSVSNERSKNRYQNNKADHLKRSKIYNEKNSAAISAQRRNHRLGNIERIRARNRKHYYDNKAAYVARARMREEHIRIATPAWADLDRILEFYVEAERLSIQTGIKHHVDHIYPLQSKIMCGLHVHTNLQILTGVENLRKSNKVLVVDVQL